MYLNQSETVVFQALPGKIVRIDLLTGKEREIVSFKSESSFGTMNVNEEKNHIYISTVEVKYKKTLFEKYRDKTLPPSKFRILDFNGNTLRKFEFDGLYLDIEVSDDEQILFTNSGTDFSIFRIK